MPARKAAPLGADFRKLWASSAISTVGDGITTAAGPLIVASLTRNPAAVAFAAFFQQLPWLLFGFFSGVLVDRFDRRRLLIAVNCVRAAALAALALAAFADVVSIPLAYAVFFVLTTADTFATPAGSALLPAVVARDRLADANVRLSLTFSVGNQFLAKPLGAWLFALAAGAPFATDALTFVLAALLIATIRPAPRAANDGEVGEDGTGQEAAGGGVRAQAAEGFRWLVGHRVHRTVVAGMVAGNVTLCAAFSVMVLYAREHLGLSSLGYGLFLTADAAGWILGTAVFRRLRGRVGAAAVLRAGLFIEAGTHLALASTGSVWVAAPVMVVFGMHGMIWGAVSATLFQQTVPDRMLGRVMSLKTMCELGGAALGFAVGGLLAQGFGLVAPFRIAGAAMLVVAVCAWRPLGGAAIE